MTTMNFEHVDLLSTLARERQQELIAEAAERRLVRRAREAHPARGRLARMYRHDPAS